MSRLLVLGNFLNNLMFVGYNFFLNGYGIFFFMNKLLV